jgi:hypothetical protein
LSVAGGDVVTRSVATLKQLTPDNRRPPHCGKPTEGVWASLKNDLDNLAACTVDALADLTRTRLKKMQCRPGLLDGFIAETGLTWTLP